LKNKSSVILIVFLVLTQRLFAQSDTIPKPLVESFGIPVVLMTAGLITQGPISRDIRTEMLNNFPNFHTSADDYLAFAPTVLPIAMNTIGINGKHKLKDQIILTILSQGLSGALTQGLKYTIAYPRPDGVGMEAFPSGHTSFAFTGAALMSKEYGQRSVWYSVAGYSMATAVGAYRMLNNRHWLADVLFGAGLGIASTEAVYRAYPWLKRKVFKDKNWTALPTYGNGVAAIYVVGVF
jgi:PAP2 superfamily